MKHKNYEMIKAVAYNTELVIFFNDTEDNEWRPCSFEMLFSPDVETEYFLCLRQHKEACLHWLNGGEAQLDHFDEPMPNSGVKGNCHLVDFYEDVNSLPWKINHPFMDEAQEFRIKPKKEKRWIGVYNHNVTSQHFDSIETAKSFIRRRDEFKNCAPEAWNFIEIEVEV